MLSALKDIISGSSNLDALNYVRLADGHAYGTDLTRWATVPFPLAAGLAPCCVPYKNLSAFLDRAGDTPPKFKQESNILRVSAGKMRASLPVLPPDALPALDHLREGTRLTMKTADLAGVIHAMANETTRPALKGVSIRRGLIEATDGHRIARRPVDGAEEMGIILPDSFAKLLAALAGDVVILTTDERTVTWEQPGGITVTSKLVDGKFPDTQNHWPASQPRKASWPRAELEAAIRTAALSENYSHAVSFRGASGQMVISGSGGNGLEFTYECAYSGDEMAFDMDVRYVLDMIAAHPGETISATFDGPGGPFLFCGDELVMPLRIKPSGG